MAHSGAGTSLQVSLFTAQGLVSTPWLGLFLGGFFGSFPNVLTIFLSFEEESLGRVRFLKGNYPKHALKLGLE